MIPLLTPVIFRETVPLKQKYSASLSIPFRWFDVLLAAAAVVAEAVVATEAVVAEAVVAVEAVEAA